MLEEKLELLKSMLTKRNELSSEETINLIGDLRQLAKEYIKINNELIEQRWKTEFELRKENAKNDAKVLRQQLVIIDKKILAGDYARKIEELIESIKNLEIQEYGASDLESNSPYRL